jgi:hypothetical protein
MELTSNKLAHIHVTMPYRTSHPLAGKQPDPNLPGFLAVVNANIYA